MAELRADRISRFGDGTEGFLLFYETEPLKDEDVLAARLRPIEIEEPEGEGD